MIFTLIDNLQMIEDYIKVGIHTGFGNDNYKLGPLKIMIDGSSSGPTASTLKPYASKPDFSGILAMTQEQVDAIVQAMTLAGVEKHMELAHMAVEDTGMGVYEDKVIKNLFSTEYIYNTIKDIKTVGIIAEHEAEGYVEIAEPVGVIAGVTPVTNPTSTTMFKALIAMKTRNPIVFSFHPKAQRCSVAAAETVLKAALAAGAPANSISWITEPSIEATNALMRHSGVAMILATGGSGLVKAAYSSGKPALGVGPGNVPAYIEASADVPQAVNDIVLSKTFDNGTICASEQAVVVDRTIAETVEQEFVKLGAYFLSPDEIKKVEQVAIDPATKQ
jgi:acetaldehyde dehydrogenase/alcohol dehydrogenase